jgi:hypothetical protein
MCAVIGSGNVPPNTSAFDLANESINMANVLLSKLEGAPGDE